MSKQQHLDAKARGFNGPFFPPELSRIVSHREITGIHLEKSGEQLPGFWGLTELTTSDGYFWFWALSFVLEEGEILVAFPWAQDHAEQDGTRNDRSPAIYTHGQVTDEDIRMILTQLGDKLPTT